MGLQEKTIKFRMATIGISCGQLSEFTGIRAQILHPGLRATQPLSNPDRENVLRTLTELEALVNLARPIPVDVTDTRKIKFLLEKMADGDLNYLASPHTRAWAEEMEAEAAGVGV